MGPLGNGEAAATGAAADYKRVAPMEIDDDNNNNNDHRHRHHSYSYRDDVDDDDPEDYGEDGAQHRRGRNSNSRSSSSNRQPRFLFHRSGNDNEDDDGDDDDDVDDVIPLVGLANVANHGGVGRSSFDDTLSFDEDDSVVYYRRTFQLVLIAALLVVAVLVAAAILVPASPGRRGHHAKGASSSSSSSSSKSKQQQQQQHKSGESSSLSYYPDHSNAIDPDTCQRLYTRNASWSVFIPDIASLSQQDRCRSPVTMTATATAGTCTCGNPVEPRLPAELERRTVPWKKEAATNLQLIHAATTTATKSNAVTVTPPPPVDVVMIGDSIAERWHGTALGRPVKGYEGNVAVYQELFQKKKKKSSTAAAAAQVQGLALGIAGDRTANVLYRLQHGEMDDALQPAVWWLMIGTNDYGSDGCNVDCVVAGCIRLTEEIVARRPNATVVINSLLPRSTSKTNMDVKWWDDYSHMNAALECYAVTRTASADGSGSTDAGASTVVGQEQVQFFNATDLFLVPDSETVTVNDKLMPDGLHPNGEGSRIWGKAIVDRVLTIKNDHQQ